MSRWLAILLFLCLAGCSRPAATPAPSSAIRPLESPAGPGSGQPNLFAAPGGRVYLTWLEPAGANETALRFATLEENGWSQARTIAQGANWFVNWADFPALAVLPGGELAAHWLVKAGGGKYAYDIQLSLSRDGGRTWSPPVKPHRDGKRTEHGFVSLVPAGGAAFGIVWLDGREFKEGGGEHDLSNEMTLRYTTVGAKGELGPEVLLDGRVCDCCQTSAAATTNGIVVVYRDRSPAEIRDISAVRFQDGRWSEPSPVHSDGWKIPGCPVNGPVVAADANNVAVAWFSAAGDSPRVNVAFSADEGRTFSPPVRVDDGKPSGRVDVALLPGGDAMVSWMESPAGGTATTLARRVSPGGMRGEPLTIATTTGARAAGFSRIRRHRNELVFAWTEPGTPSRVLTAKATYR